MAERGVLVRSEYVRLAGDLVVGTLLSQIAYWYLPTKTGTSKLRVQRKGVYWIAKTRDEWMAETGLTLKQYKRAVAVLKAKQLVEVKVMKFKGIAMGHLRLLQPIAGPLVPKAPTGGAKKDQPMDGPKGTNPYTESTTESTDRTCATGARTDEDHGGEKDPREIRREEEDNRTEVVGKDISATAEVGMKATDILKQHTQPVTGNLATYWKARLRLVQGGFQQPVTGKEAGQLKLLHKSLGSRTKPVIDYAIEHWGKFASFAVAVGQPFPPRPHIGFLLKHHAVAVNLLTPEVIPLPVVEPVQLIAIGAEPEVPHVLTPQELAEILDKLTSP